MTIKIGVISDTHLNSVTGKLEDIYRKYLAPTDIILHAGDHVSTAVVEFFYGHDFYGVYGNMDPFNVREMLPDKRIINLGNYKIGLIHGWGPKEGLEDRVGKAFSDVEVIVYGHSHVAANRIRDGVLFFNPGTAIGYSSSGPHSIGILEVGNDIKGKIVYI